MSNTGYLPEHPQMDAHYSTRAHHVSPAISSSRQLANTYETFSLSPSFRTPQDEAIAYEILARKKEVKIESRSRVSRVFMTKSKRTKYNPREIHRALESAVNGQERAGPGIVEVLRDLLVAEGGDVNIIPPKKTIGTIMRKNQKERTGLLEMAAKDGNVEFVQILSQNSDKPSLDSSLEIALRNRGPSNAARSTMRQDQMIQILISKGADGSNTISAAVSTGDSTLLRMLLDGRPPNEALSEALPLSVTFPEIETRWSLLTMLLENGADVNQNNGESILHATRLFDLTSLDFLLNRRPQTTSLSQAFDSALNQLESAQRFQVCQRLVQAGAFGEEVNKGLMIAVTVEQGNIDFLKLILQNANVNFQDGKALCLCITNDCQTHLRLMLNQHPNETTFDHAFAAAIRLRNPRDQLKYCRLLVEVGPGRDSCSKALVLAAKSQKQELCKVLLENGASPNHDGGASISAVTLAGNIGILELLVVQKPDNISLVAGFEVALTYSASQTKKTTMLKLILDAGLMGPSLDLALISSAKQGREGLQLCKLFLDYGASVDAEGGEALDFSTRSGNLELLQLLLSGPPPSVETLSRIFQSSQALDSIIRHPATKYILEANMPINAQVAAALDALVQERNIDMQTINLLLSFGASVHYENHRPLVIAARTFKKTLLSLLLEHSTTNIASSVVFDSVMKLDSLWGKEEAFAILTILLEDGAHGVAVDQALIKAVSDPQQDARYFEVTLLRHNVNIDYKNGEALQIATERGEPDLVRRMLDLTPSSSSLSKAFPFAFHSKLGERSVLAVIDAFAELSAGELDPYFVHPEIPEPPIFLCLHHYPNSISIIKSTLRAGFYIDEPMSDDNGRYTALYYALSMQGKMIEDPVIELLINEGADLHNHPIPLLHLAIEGGRDSIVQCLIGKGADVDSVNDNNITALCICVMKSDLQNMQTLLNAGASSNDGSLHEAARMVDSDAIKLLLDHGHDPNFPAMDLEGRPPLFELCFQAPSYLHQSQAPAQQKEKQAKKAIQALINGGALTDGQLPQAGYRSILLHALDSSNPHMITKAFLESGQFKDINKNYNLFSDGTYTYSPTKYVEKGKCRGKSNTQSQSLIKLLSTFSATPRFWKNESPQPPDMINPPPEIAQAEATRKAAEEQRRREEELVRLKIQAQQEELATQRRKLALEQEAEQAKQQRRDLIFRQEEVHAQKMHAAELAKENDKLRLREASDERALKHAQSLSQLRINENELEQRRRLQLLGERKQLVQSEAVLMGAYSQGLQDAEIGGGRGGRRALGMSTRSNLDLRGRRRIEGPPAQARITELDES